MLSTQDYLVNNQFKIGGNNRQAPVQQPITVAPATPRMMGKSCQQQNNNGLMPPVDLSQPYTLDQHHTHLKPFHRKSLGDWDFLETIGAGSMGKVKLAKHRYTNEVCAIKIVNRATKSFLHNQHQLPPPSSEEERLEQKKKLEKEVSRDKRTIREASLGQILYHPHIGRLFEMCTMSNHFYMLFEYVSGGQLLDYIIQHGSLRERHARKFARGIASALIYLHQNNIVHRDLKIENIMISTSGEIKIIDFGLSNMYDQKKQLHTFCGSLYFAAPELLKAQPYIGPEVDIWSFGVVLYVLVCGKVPFDDENASVLHEKIKQGKVEYPQKLSIEIISLLSKMLVVDPKKRASLKQVINHQWMQKGYDCIVPSYIPHRVPMTLEMLDSTVIKEMHRLELIQDIGETTHWLESIISSDEYQNLSRQYWANIDNNKDVDPTAAYHPILSIYYLVDEMLKRKRAKLQRKVHTNLTNKLASPPPTSANNDSNMSKLQDSTNIIQATNSNQVNILTKEEDVKLVSPRLPLQQPQPPQQNQLTHISNKKNIASSAIDKSTGVSLPKLSVPEQAHTTPRRSEDKNADMDAVLSPTPQSNDHEISKHYKNPSATSTTLLNNPNERTKLGSIFRKLSQRHRHTASQHNHPSGLTEEQSIMTTNQQPRALAKVKKTHSRTLSENVPSTEYFSSTYAHRSSQPNPDIPALPSNARTLVREQQQQLQGNLERLNIDEVSQNNEDAPVQLLSVPKGRKLHPSARAKSVGHARRESLKYVQPPIPINQSVYTNGDTRNNSKVDNEQVIDSGDDFKELTDKQILVQTSKAPIGSMPSIDYPRSLFLKGFFSVQTTSSKPLPIVRYKIISTLKKLNIEFKEIKGGFICVHRQSYIPTIKNSPTTHAQQYNTSLNDALSLNLNNNVVSSSHMKQYSTSSRQSFVKHQASLSGKLNYGQQSGISATITSPPHPRERSLSSNSPHDIIGNPEELSTASLESSNQDDALTVSKAQDVNQKDDFSDNEEGGSHTKEKPPLKFGIHIVKVRIVGLAGVHFKKVSGNTWMYKELATHILKELNL